MAGIEVGSYFQSVGTFIWTLLLVPSLGRCPDVIKSAAVPCFYVVVHNLKRLYSKLMV